MVNNKTFYKNDLAFVHDQGYGQFAQNAAQTIWLLLKDRPQNSEIIDLGCGSGILEKELADKNLNLTGVDYSPSMIKLAKQNAPGATFYTSSFYDFDIPRCDVVCSIGECFNYLLDMKSDLNELKELFARIHYFLKPEGHFVFDILTQDLLETSYVRSRIIEQDLWTIFIDMEADRDKSILTRNITLFLKHKDCYKKSKEIHRQRLYDKNHIATILKGIGFDITQIDGYNRLTFRPGHIGFVCKK